jgi:dTDP-4-dehydrorhamnose 3,5-epimerase
MINVEALGCGYAPKFDRCIIWDDKTLGIEWPIEHHPILSKRDAHGMPLSAAEVFA